MVYQYYSNNEKHKKWGCTAFVGNKFVVYFCVNCISNLLKSNVVYKQKLLTLYSIIKRLL